MVTQDTCAESSIFHDRDGEHFGQVLQYLRDDVVTVAEQEASELDMSDLSTVSEARTISTALSCAWTSLLCRNRSSWSVAHH
jgi:hypothetical protein